jgi:hypothetical protein
LKGKQGTDVKHGFYIRHILHILILPGPGGSMSYVAYHQYCVGSRPALSVEKH